ncbi:hypothetical protein [Thermoflavimicrobium daqui]|uniref:Uncharacterized protein n=1 Tax=Thermoflavimicrobium daqui TaxID=2137476 RepID=A0A364K477_9BACL|nr:hypothetical protein [Thermoflavimicrobium daqui]RAL24162.1 hypothetical protein DL897_10785 [Thermoflavimicrobium daqui]
MANNLEQSKNIGEEEYLLVEQYKDITASRQHYSSLRFALLPVFLAIQGAILNSAINIKADQAIQIPIYLFALAACLITYVFWTIEERINLYYQQLESIGAELEDLLGYQVKMIKKWSKTSFSNNTKLSIRIIHFSFPVVWLYIVIFLS